jgi:hypothetical protein
MIPLESKNLESRTPYLVEVSWGTRILGMDESQFMSDRASENVICAEYTRLDKLKEFRSKRYLKMGLLSPTRGGL